MSLAASMRERELSTLLEGTADAAFTVDLQGQIRTWNRAAGRMFGDDAASVLGRSCAAVINGHGPTGAQVCKPGCPPLDRACRSAGGSDSRADASDIVNFDMETRSEVRSLWVNVSILFATEPTTERRFVVHLLRDISDRKRAERFTANVLALARRLETAKHPARDPPTLPLTAQELRILELLRGGEGTKEIARKLEISIGTLRNHIHDPIASSARTPASKR
jgi:DNA-binding CsgD family transcriptional regulator